MAKDRKLSFLGAFAVRTTALALALLAPPAYAAALRIADATLQVGRVQLVSLIVDDASGLEAADLTIAYDPGVVRIVGPLRRSALAEGCLLVANTAPPGTLRIALACLFPLRGAGALFTVPFEAHGVGHSIIAITACRVNDQPCDSHPQGVVTVRHHSPATEVSAAP